MSVRQRNIIRPPTANEWFHAVMCHRHLFSGVWIGTRYSKELNKNELIQALKGVIIDHPWLLANLFYSSPKVKRSDARWELIEQLDLENVVEFCNTDECAMDDPKSYLNKKNVVDIIGEGLGDTTNQKNGVLWRLIVVNNTEVCLFFNHALMDGKSAHFFHQSLLYHLRLLESSPALNIGNTEKDNIIKISDLGENIVIPPNPDEMMSVKPNFLYILGILAIEYLPRIFWPRSCRTQWKVPPPLTATPDVFPEKFSLPRLQIQFINLNSQETSSIIRVCKANHVSVTTYLSVLVTDCVSHFSGQKCMRMNIAADFRKSIPKSSYKTHLKGIEPKKVWGFYATTVEGCYNDEKATPFWEKVSKFSNELKRLTTPSKLLSESFISLTGFLPDLYNYLDKWCVCKNINTVYFSNLGYIKYDYSADSKFNIERMSFCTASTSASLIVDAVTTNDNDIPMLSLSLSGGDTLLRGSNQRTIDSLVDELRQRLKSPEKDFNLDPKLMSLSKFGDHENTYEVTDKHLYL